MRWTASYQNSDHGLSSRGWSTSLGMQEADDRSLLKRGPTSVLRHRDPKDGAAERRGDVERLVLFRLNTYDRLKSSTKTSTRPSATERLSAESRSCNSCGVRGRSAPRPRLASDLFDC